MRKKKIVISLMLVLLMLLVVYQMFLPSAKQEAAETEVVCPYTNWMSEPDEAKESGEKGVITFEQEDK